MVIVSWCFLFLRFPHFYFYGRCVGYSHGVRGVLRCFLSREIWLSLALECIKCSPAPPAHFRAWLGKTSQIWPSRALCLDLRSFPKPHLLLSSIPLTWVLTPGWNLSANCEEASCLPGRRMEGCVAPGRLIMKQCGPQVAVAGSEEKNSCFLEIICYLLSFPNKLSGKLSIPQKQSANC